MIRASLAKLLLIALLLGTGLLLEISGLVETRAVLEFAREYAHHWWLILILILLQGVLFTFALAGSLALWIAAPLYPPAMASFILVAGGTMGGLGAYWFSRRLTDDWTGRIEDSSAYRLLQRRGNFFTLFAIRVFPAFPHSLVNYSSGILRVKLWQFVAATIAGLSIKSWIYCKAIYAASSSATLADLLDPWIYAPLIILSILSLTWVLFQSRSSD